jgi:hypothetical protein
MTPENYKKFKKWLEDRYQSYTRCSLGVCSIHEKATWQTKAEVMEDIINLLKSMEQE